MRTSTFLAAAAASTVLLTAHGAPLPADQSVIVSGTDNLVGNSAAASIPAIGNSYGAIADASSVINGVVAEPAQSITMPPAPQPMQMMLLGGNGPTVSGLKVSTGINSGVDPNIIPRGNIFLGYDARPRASGDVAGFQARPVWTQESVEAAVGTTSASQNVITQSGVIKSEHDFAKQTQVKSKVTGAAFGVSAEATFGYNSEEAASTNLVSGFTYATMSLPGTMLAKLEQLQLQPDALEMLTTDVNAFLDTFGTHFIKVRTYGCEASATYKYTCETRSAKLDLEASLSATIGSGSTSAGGEVSNKYSTYRKSNICQFDGQWFSTGGVVSAPHGKLMDDDYMNNVWSQFQPSCEANAATKGGLLYVVLGNWLEVSVVANAVKSNSTARDLLDSWTYMTSADLDALAAAGTYLGKTMKAAQNIDPNQHFNPVFQSGFFDRQTHGPASPVAPSASYWTNLPSQHANIVQRLGQAAFDNFASAAHIQQAMAAGQGIAPLIRQYFDNARQLYIDATQAYRYTYADVQAVFSYYTGWTTGPDTGVRGVFKQTLSGKVGANTAQCDSNGYCSWQWYNIDVSDGGRLNLWGGIHKVASTAVPGAQTLVASMDGYTQDNSGNKIGYIGDGYNVNAEANTHDSVTAADTQWHNALGDDNAMKNMCGQIQPGSCPSAALELKIVWTMPDISLDANPYFGH